MAHAYTVRLPDGKEYGPADLDALEAWKAEGRIGPDTLVWREGASDWRPLSQILETGELQADVVLPVTVTVAPRPSPAEPAEPAEPTAAPVESVAPAEAARAPASRPRPLGPKRTARRPRPSPLRIVVPVVVVALVGGGVFLWWRAGQPARDRERAEGEIRRFGVPDRRFADDSLGWSVDLPAGWIVLRPDSPFFHAPAAKLRLAHPGLRAFARLLALPRVRGFQSREAGLDRALEDWRLFAAVQEEGRADTTVAGTPARQATVTWSTEGQESRGKVVVWRDGWNELALLAWGPGTAAIPVNSATDALVSRIQMTGAAGAKIRAGADVLGPRVPELSRGAVEALVEDRLAADQPTDDLPQSSIRVVSRGLLALTAQETQEMGQIYAQVYKPLKEKERARLAAWLAQVRSGSSVVPEEGVAMRQALSDVLLTLPEDIRARLQVLNEKAVTAALAQP